MSADSGGELGYDTTNLRALQQELRRLNAAAYAEGLLGKVPAPRAEPVAATSRAKGKAAGGAKSAGRAGKAAARRLLTTAGRLDDDDSPDVPGTRFTEAGVVRLLAHLRRRRRNTTGPWWRFLTRIEHGLSLPVAAGQHLVAGVALARLQIVCRQLFEIERHGLAHLAARRGIRRRRAAEGISLMLGGGAPPPLEKGTSS